MSNTNNIIIEDENPEFGGSGSGNITGEVTDPVEITPNYIDADSLNLLPLSTSEPSIDDILVYDGTLYAPTSMVLPMLEDVTLDSLSDKNILSYDSTTSKWINTSIDTLVDDGMQFDSIIDPSVQDILSYNGTKWVPISRESLLNSFPLTNIADVSIDTKLNNQLLSYNSTTSKWENKTLSFYDLPEINTSNLSGNDFLVYNSTTSKWENTELTSEHLSNFSNIEASANDSLIYNTDTNKWDPISIVNLSTLVSGETDLLELKNVTIANKQNNQFLSWDSATQQWINHTPELKDLSDFNSSNNPSNKDILEWDSNTSTWKSTELSVASLFNFSIEEASTGKTLVYNSVTSKWEPKLLTLEQLADPSIDPETISNNSGLYWNSTENKWEISKKSFEDVLALEGINDNEILSYNSTTSKWEAVDISTLVQLSQNLSDLNDINISSPSVSQSLVWDSNNNEWINKQLTLSDIKTIDLSNISNAGTLVYNNITSKWEVKVVKLETLIDETLDTNSIEENSTIHWNSATDKWEVKKQSLEEVLGFPTTTDNNSVLVYDKPNQEWKTELVDNLFTFSNDLESLIDINVNELTTEDILVYNSVTSKWENQKITTNLLEDINNAGLTDGNVLSWNESASRWEPLNVEALITTSIEGSSLGDESNVTITNPSVGEILTYKSSTSTWENTRLIPSSFEGLTLVGQDTSKYLTWNIPENKWEFKSYSFFDTFDINTEDLVEGNVLIWDDTNTTWKVIEAYELSDYTAGEIDLGELKNVDAPNKLHNQVLTWDSALQNWVPKNLADLGATISGNINILGNDWVTLFNNNLNY